MNLIRNLWNNRSFILTNAVTELRFRYAGTTLGVFWNILNPLLESLIYIVVFQNILSYRSPNREANYALFLIAGLFPWFAFSQLVTNGLRTYVRNQSSLRVMSIPQEVFVAIELVVSFLTLMVYLAIIAIVYALKGQALSWGWLLLPVLGFLFLLLGFAISLSLANIRVFFPDMDELIRHLVHMWRWTLPIIYSIDIFPPVLQKILMFNPPYFFIVSIRALITDNTLPAPSAILIMLAWVAVFLLPGMWVNQRLYKEIRDYV